ncbi:hypothetical protein BDV29DRAFT_167545 [Aspergillus leporis]|uniref:Uncharacterized protein n=1 Tax=Aspergillus leporis TaxID=41062 RepID=A0A5N5XAY5_9EURO|nr:hypothetical protein BDV29DRAFT_167545 [Aspergillus leporis]
MTTLDLGIATKADKDLVKKGDQAAHDGDCRAESQLYLGPEWPKDLDIYVGFYGLTPEIVHKIYYDSTIFTLKWHATLAAYKSKKPQSDELCP